MSSEDPLREYLRANMFDGSEDGTITMHTSALLDEVCEIAREYWLDARPDTERWDRLRDAIERAPLLPPAFDQWRPVLDDVPGLLDALADETARRTLLHG